MSIAIWTQSKDDRSFEEFIGDLHQNQCEVSSVTVLTRVKETHYDERSKEPLVDKVIEEATSIAVIYQARVGV